MSPKDIGVALSAFLGSGVEFVEMAAFVLTVGSTKGWTDALVGGGSAVVTLIIVGIAAFFGLTRFVSFHTVQAVFGTFLLLLGLSWLQKATFDLGHLKPEQDEGHKAAATMKKAQSGRKWVAIFSTFQQVFVDGLEATFIVVGVASAGTYLAAGIGVAAAALLVFGAAVAVSGYLKKIPDAYLKAVAGLMLAAFGTFWVGEGFGLHWFRSDLFILFLFAGYLVLFGLLIYSTRKSVQQVGA